MVRVGAGSPAECGQVPVLDHVIRDGKQFERRTAVQSLPSSGFGRATELVDDARGT